ncbi:hypothetical protein OK074_5314 [Actinobacteria bacterium OK074]|nr:hypothetical protein OK074_5314 [Actinobacteria bacterium OK074]
MTWRDWGSPRARGTGVAEHLSCVGGCPDSVPGTHRFEAVLSGLVKHRHAAYYSHAA